jgi:hypothetical protein
MKPAISSAVILQIKDMAAQGGQTKEIARHLGLSISTVHKVRQGYYDHRLGQPAPRPDDEGPAMVAVWCPRCRCHIYPPCQVCRLRAHQRRLRASAAGKLAAPAVGVPKSGTAAKLDLSVAEIGLPVRVVNYLQQRQVLTVNDLLHCTPGDLLRIPNFAAKTLEQVYRCLARLGFQRQSAATERPALRPAA